MSAIGPVPFAGMVLADMGADVVRVDRPGESEVLPGTSRGVDVLGRGKRSVVVDLKHPDGAGVVLDLVASADVLLEGLRPGVMERLGVGPEECLAVNERLIYGRMTGFGQDGPLAAEAGHDINYISIAGVLSRIGRAGQAPVPPLNLVGDFGGGAMFLVTGVLGALVERATSGRGQVVDAAMIDGAALLTAGMFGGPAAGPRGLEPARHRRAVLRRLRDGRRQVPVGGARSSRGSGPRSWPGSASTRPRHPGPRRLAGGQGRGRRRHPHPQPRRVGGAVHRRRRVRHAGARTRRAVRPPPAHGPVVVRRGRRRPSAGAGTAPVAVDRRDPGRARRRTAPTPTTSSPPPDSTPTASPRCAPPGPSAGEPAAGGPVGSDQAGSSVSSSWPLVTEAPDSTSIERDRAGRRARRPGSPSSSTRGSSARCRR